MSNIDRYKSDIELLVLEGELLKIAMMIEYFPEKIKKAEKTTKEYKNEIKELKKDSPKFSEKYQSWYSQALECIGQLLPSRVEDFISYYKPSGERKQGEINAENYTIKDCLNGGLKVMDRWGRTVGPDAAFPKFIQQLKIVESMKARFESSLFDIRALLQADLFDNELDAAEELAQKGFLRGSGALAGVVLESHLKEICVKHKIKITKKKPTISDCNDALKNKGVIDLPVWRQIQHLADIRNLCDHPKGREPKKEEIDDLNSGVRKVSKTVF